MPERAVQLHACKNISRACVFAKQGHGHIKADQRTSSESSLPSESLGVYARLQLPAWKQNAAGDVDFQASTQEPGLGQGRLEAWQQRALETSHLEAAWAAKAAVLERAVSPLQNCSSFCCVALRAGLSLSNAFGSLAA